MYTTTIYGKHLRMKRAILCVVVKIRQRKSDYMINIRFLFYKMKYIFFNTSKFLYKIVCTALTLLGLLLTIAEFIQYAFGTDIIYQWIHMYAAIICIGSFMISFYKNRVKLEYEYFLKGTDVKVNLKVTDILKSEAAIVIPTNTTFDTLMEDEFISKNSVQGQVQKLYFEDNLGVLDRLIENGLSGVSYDVLNRSGSKCKKYPIGTVCKITYDNKHFYFVGIADINEHGKPINTNFENVQKALEGVWCFLDDKGHLENLAIPLIGTGKAGIREATREKVVKEIVSSFNKYTQKSKISEKLQICIHPSDLEQKDLKLLELSEYVKYVCKYGDE